MGSIPAPSGQEIFQQNSAMFYSSGQTVNREEAMATAAFGQHPDQKHRTIEQTLDSNITANDVNGGAPEKQQSQLNGGRKSRSS